MGHIVLPLESHLISDIVSVLRSGRAHPFRPFVKADQLPQGRSQRGIPADLRGMGLDALVEFPSVLYALPGLDLRTDKVLPVLEELDAVKSVLVALRFSRTLYLAAVCNCLMPIHRYDLL